MFSVALNRFEHDFFLVSNLSIRDFSKELHVSFELLQAIQYLVASLPQVLTLIIAFKTTIKRTVNCERVSNNVLKS